MLQYNHIFNTNLDFPYHVHYIESSSTSVAINLNGVMLGYFKPTAGTKFSFTNIVDPGATLLELIVVGSRQTYTRQLNRAIFKDSNVKYVYNASGKYLNLNPINGKYYWSTIERTRFFFNPFYFNSRFLWEQVVGYVPSGLEVADVYELSEAQQLFTPQNIFVDDDWVGEKEIPDVGPIPNGYFSTATAGISKTYHVDYLIEELQDLKDGDIININNGTDSINIKVENTWTNAVYPSYVETSRPIVHVPIDITNPNKRIVYSKALDKGEQKIINLELYGNIIQFNIKRT